MKQEERKIIFLNSYFPRTGHNFASEAIKVFTDHEVLPHNQSETKLSTLLDSYLKVYDSKINATNYKSFFDHLFIEDLRERILAQSQNKFVMIKDTTFKGAESLVEVFPDDIHILLLRDPNMVFNSLVKAMNLSKSTFKNRIKKVGIATGIYPFYYSRKLSNQVLKILPNFGKFYVLRYENLVLKDEKTILELKGLFGSKKSKEQLIAEIDKLPVINSSFFEEVKGQKIWDRKPKTAQFNPIDRKGNPFLTRKGIAMGSKKLRSKLKYNN